MDDYLNLDAQMVKTQIEALKREYPELAEDEAFAAEVWEAETDLHRILERALERRQEAKSMEAAIGERIKAMGERKSRYGRQGDAMTKLMQSLMECAHQDKITLPEATLSITKPRESVNVTNVDELPQGYFQTIRQADKKALKDALMRGDQIPGAELALGDSGLMVRTK